MLETKRIVYERGLEIKKHGSDWIIPNAIVTPKCSVEQILKHLSIRPLLLVESDSEQEYKSLLSYEGGRLSDLRNYIKTKYCNPEHFDLMKNIDYLLGAIIFHCEELADLYSDICMRAVAMNKIVDLAGKDWSLANEYKPYYEFEALITRYMLWNLFGPGKGTVPSSFSRTFPLCENLPADLKNRLETSWENIGKPLKEYRDCIQHYVPLGNSYPNAVITKVDDLLITSLLMPDNPEARTHTGFTYNTKTDLLRYSWDLVNEVCNVSVALANAL
jgi:hypothetical protein